MFGAIFWTAVGVVVGWHLPEPAWAKSLKEKVLAKFGK